MERCVLALTERGDWVLDPYGGVGSAAVAALKNGRRAISVDREQRYVDIARQRIRDLESGKLVTRRIGTPVYQPTGRERVSRIPGVGIVQVAGRYSFNGGREFVEKIYPGLLAEVLDAILEVDSRHYKTKASAEKTMLGTSLLFNPPEINAALKSHLAKRGWKAHREPCVNPDRLLRARLLGQAAQ